MGFGEAVKSCFSKYATFSGRARRSEFWWFYLFTVIVYIVASLIDNLLGFTIVTSGENGTAVASYSPGWVSAIAGLALILPWISVQVRRLHDRDATGWWWWLNVLCCIGPLVLIFAFYVQPGTPGPNKYGPDPKGELGA
jgi:uncharacterized membrane protein YhaH (DUF805 family)